MLPENVWNTLVRRTNEGKVTPFLGAGASYPAVPLGGQCAREMAEAYQYPFDNTTDLMRVSQYVAVDIDPLEPKEWMLRRLEEVTPPALADDEPHHVLAGLPLPVYMTTNYDDFMVRALKSLRPIPRDPRREYCRWHDGLNDEPTTFEQGYTPNPANPLVFHLHGHTRPDSLVVTEDDYIQFLARIGDVEETLPAPVRQAMSRTTFLFLGYSLADWDFRILFNALRPLQPALSIAVLRPPDDPIIAEKQSAYLGKLYGRMNLTLCWTTAREFAAELAARCRAA